MQSNMIEGETRCVLSLDKTSDERLSRIYFIVLNFVAASSIRD